jgi:hypothetical protein
VYGATLANVAQGFTKSGKKLVVFQALQGKFRPSGYGNDHIARPIGEEEYDSYSTVYGAVSAGIEGWAGIIRRAEQTYPCYVISYA